MAPSRTVLIAGAGIGGLTAAMALARAGFRVVCFEKSDKLEEVGAGLQLSPNATRILIDLGVAPALTRRAVVPESIHMHAGRSGRELAVIPLGEEATFRFGAPYWVVHRGELQSALLETVAQNPDIELRLGHQFEDAATHANGVTVVIRHGLHRTQEQGLALIGADGVWSAVRKHMKIDAKPQFGGRTAWRGTLDATLLPRDFAAPRVRLWMGSDAHLVTYPVKDGQRVNVVAVVADTWNRPGWSEPGDVKDIAARFAFPQWATGPRMVISSVEEWKRWALFELPLVEAMNAGPIALLGDAAHAMVPFLAQGAAMAIEDAWVVAKCLAATSDNVAEALRRYDAQRAGRVAHVQRAARKAGQIYHLSGLMGMARNLSISAMGGARLRSRYDWIYDWRYA